MSSSVKGTCLYKGSFRLEKSFTSSYRCIHLLLAEFVAPSQANMNQSVTIMINQSVSSKCSNPHFTKLCIFNPHITKYVSMQPSRVAQCECLTWMGICPASFSTRFKCSACNAIQFWAITSGMRQVSSGCSCVSNKCGYLRQDCICVWPWHAILSDSKAFRMKNSYCRWQAWVLTRGKSLRGGGIHHDWYAPMCSPRLLCQERRMGLSCHHLSSLQTSVTHSKGGNELE